MYLSGYTDPSITSHHGSSWRADVSDAAISPTSCDIQKTPRISHGGFQQVGLEGSSFLGSLAVGDWNFRNPKWSKDEGPPRMKFHIPGTQMTSIFEGQPPKTRPFPIKTKIMNEFHNGWWFLQDFEVINLREERSNLTSYS